MQLFIQIAVSMALGIAGLIVLILGMRWFRSGSVSKRLNQYVASPLDNTHSRANTARIPARVITGSFFNRTFLPVFRGIGRFFGMTNFWLH